MDIDLLYEKLYSPLESIQKQYEEKKDQIEKKSREIDKRINEILPYRTSAKAYISQSFANRSFPAHRTEISALENLFYQASSSGANSTICWERLYESAASGIAYFQQEKNRITAGSGSSGTYGTFSSFDADCEKLLMGADALNLKKALQVCAQQYPVEVFSGKAFNYPQSEQAVPFGWSARPLPVTDGCIRTAKQVFGNCFISDNREILLPCTIPAVTLLQVGLNTAETVLGGIRAYILGFINYSAPCRNKIYYIDTCSMDPSCLGVLKPLLDDKCRVIVPVPINQSEVQQKLASLRQESTSSKKQSRRLLVYRFRQSSHNSQFDPYLQWLCANAGNYNYQVIVVQETSRDLSDLPRQVPEWIPPDALIMRFGAEGFLETSISHSKIAIYSEPASISENVLRGIFEAYAPAPLQNEYFKVYPEHFPAKRMRKKTISLLYGLGDQSEKKSLDLTGMDFSAYILGSSRSGKTNMLHALITSAVMDYHPDDLELWLVDFGRVGFDRYITNTPPHVRYVLVEKTQELVCSLVNKLIEEMERRGKIMAQNHVEKMMDLPETVQMPMLLVIIDEFGVFKEILSSDDFEEKRTYRAYMERLLKQGAKHGMCFIFSNQSISDISSVLPDEASDQIGLRVTMLGDRREMKAVLKMSGYQLTKEEESRIEALPKYQVLYRSREQGNVLSNPVHVLNISEKSNEEKQRALIEKMNKVFSPMASSRFDSPEFYFPREQLCLAYNRVPSFSDRYPAMERDLRQWKQNAAYQDTNLLLYFGEPRNMEPVHHELLRKGRAENVLLYGDYARGLNSIASVIAGAVNSALFQGWPVEFWCDENDPLARNYIEKWRQGTIINDSNLLVSRVRELDRQVRNGDQTKRFIILTGLSSMILSIRDEMEEKTAYGGDREISDDELDRIRALMAKGNVKESYDNESSESVDNLIHILQNLLKFGPRHNVHFLIAVQKERELYDAGLSIDCFTHYVAFANGMSDTEFIQLKRRVNRISEDYLFGCLTGNGEFTVYIPFQ